VLDDDPAPGRRDQGGVAVSVDRGRRVAWHLSLRGAEGEGIGSRFSQTSRTGGAGCSVPPPAIAIACPAAMP
jgi:hypothetical protein